MLSRGCRLHPVAHPLARRVHAAIINNLEHKSESGTFTSDNPATREPVGHVGNCGVEEAVAAVDAARQCFSTFKNSMPGVRAEVLVKWGDSIRANGNTIAELVTMEMGKPKKEALGEVVYATSFLYHFASQISTYTSGSVLARGQPQWRPVSIRQPVGVVATITPWNFPIAMITRKVGAAIAAGCSVINSPSEDTPLTALYLAKLAISSGFPPGLLNVIPSERTRKQELGEVLCSSPEVAALSFTGSTAVGKLLYKQCGDTIKRVHLELGGNAPFIIFPSADLDRAVRGAMAAKFRNAGQACNAANRFLVHSSIYGEFLERLSGEVEKLRMGNGLEDGVDMGPLVNDRAFDRVSGIVDRVGGHEMEVVGRSRSDHYPCPFYSPSILSFGSNSDIPIFHEEIFGPVVSTWSFTEEEEALRLANSTRYGLQAYIFTRDLSQAWRVAEELEYGMVAINEGVISNPNNPFGGWKESGIGREGGPGGVDEFSEDKIMCFGL